MHVSHHNTNTGRGLITNTYTVGRADVTDHVPVDDNPAYITMKRITLNKNSAYETVTVASHYETVDMSAYENVNITS